MDRETLRAQASSQDNRCDVPKIPAVSAEQVALIPQFEECRRVWLPVLDRQQWQAHWIDDGPGDRLVFYCPESAERGLGDA